MLSALVALLLLGAIAGLLAGLLGVGGGLVLVAGLVWLLPQLGVPETASMHAALATSLGSIVFTGLSSARAHQRRGSVIWPSVRRLVPGLLLGGIAGARLATALPGDALRYAVAAFCVLAALQLLFGQPRAHGHSAAPNSPWLLLAGALIGAVSAIVGIGGGSMTVPLLIWLGAMPVRAVGSSAACGVAIACSSALGYALFGPLAAVSGMPAGSIGYLYLPAALGIALASVVAAPYGTALAHRIGGLALKRVFAGLLLLVAISLLR